MSYTELTKDIRYHRGQESESLVPKKDYDAGELFSLGREDNELTTGFRSEQNNRQRIYSTMYDQAVADGDTKRAEQIKLEQDENEKTDTTYFQDLQSLFTSNSIVTGMKIYNEVNEYFNPKEIERTPIQQEYVDKANDEIIESQKEIEKIDGFWNNVFIGAGSASVDFQHPAFLATLPASFYTSTGRAAVGATAKAFLGRNALYTLGREVGVAALAESFIQYEAYKYSQTRVDEERGIKAMTLSDVAANVAINSLFAGGAGAIGSVGIDLGKITIHGSKKFATKESVQAFRRTGDLSGVDYKQLKQILSNATFDREIEDSVVLSIKKFMDTSPSSDMNLHTASMTKAAIDIDTKGATDFQEDSITTPIQESNAGDHIDIRDAEGNSYVGKVLSSTDKDVTIQYGDKEVTLNKEDGLSTTDDGLYSAQADPVTTPAPKAADVNEVNPNNPSITQEPDAKVVQDLAVKYENDPEVILANKEIDDSLKEFEDIFELEPEEPKVETPENRGVNEEVPPSETPVKELDPKYESEGTADGSKLDPREAEQKAWSLEKNVSPEAADVYTKAYNKVQDKKLADYEKKKKQKELDEVKKKADVEVKAEEKPKPTQEAAPTREDIDASIDNTKDKDLVNHKDFKATEETINKYVKPKSDRLSNADFKTKMETEPEYIENEDLRNQAWRDRMQETGNTESYMNKPELTKTALKRIKKGNGTTEDFEALRADMKEQGQIDFEEIPETITFTKEEIDGAFGDEIPFAKFGPELLGGSVAGIEENEDGSYTLDPAAFVVGMVLGTTAKRVAKLGLDLKVQKSVMESLDRVSQDFIEKYQLLEFTQYMAPVKSQRQKSIRGIHNVTYNNKKSTDIRKSDLESFVKYERGTENKKRGKGYGSKHIQKHLEDGSVGYTTQHENAMIHDIIQEDSFTIDEDTGARIYEEVLEDGSMLRVVVDDKKKGERIITFYTDRNLKVGDNYNGYRGKPSNQPLDSTIVSQTDKPSKGDK